ncbi:MAG: DUF1015 domain-containing protein [Actinomycetes bacterium]
MGKVEPLRALHYDTAVTGGLQPVVAPPYDVIDAEGRAALVAQSPNNIVVLDLPEGDDPYASAAAILHEWIANGVLIRDETPALWAVEQVYDAPGGAGKLTRRGFLSRMAVEEYGRGRVLPHERTHAGPKEDRLRLTRATATNLSPIFALFGDPDGVASGALEGVWTQEPFGEALGHEGTLTRVWRVDEPEIVAAVCEAASQSELLIADGHHRYETARVFAEEDGSPAGADSLLAYLVASEDPGLVVFPTHRLARGLGDAEWAALDAAIAQHFDVETVAGATEPDGKGGDRVQIGLLDSRDGSTKMLTLRDPSSLDEPMEGRSAAYRQLDTGVLEALLLRGPLGLTEDRIDHLDGFAYARDLQTAVDAVASGASDVAFLMGPTPVDRIRAIAEAGEYMPPKSTYFFPKIPTGIVLNPLDK